MIQNKTKYGNIKAFYKTHVYTRTTSGTILSVDVWINGGQVIFQYKPGAYLSKVSLLKIMDGKLPPIFIISVEDMFSVKPYFI